MKRCPYCGRENADEATICHECGNYVSNETSESGNERERLVPSCRSKVWLLLMAWAAALLSLLPFASFVFFKPTAIIWLPLGLVETFTEEKATLWITAFGWLFYAGLTTLILKAKRRHYFIAFYLILLFALVINVRGCYHAFQTKD